MSYDPSVGSPNACFDVHNRKKVREGERARVRNQERNGSHIPLNAARFGTLDLLLLFPERTEERERTRAAESDLENTPR